MNYWDRREPKVREEFQGPVGRSLFPEVCSDLSVTPYSPIQLPTASWMKPSVHFSFGWQRNEPAVLVQRKSGPQLWDPKIHSSISRIGMTGMMIREYLETTSSKQFLVPLCQVHRDFSTAVLPWQVLSSLSSYPVPQLVSLWQRKEPSVFMQTWPMTQLWLPVRHSLTSEEWDMSKIRAAVNMQPGLIHKSCHRGRCFNFHHSPSQFTPSFCSW